MVQRYSHLAPDYQEGAIRVLDSRWHDLGTEEPTDDDEETPKALKKVVPPAGLEPATPALRMRRSKCQWSVKPRHLAHFWLIQ